MAASRVEGFMTQLEENGYALLSNLLPATEVDALLNAIENMRTRQNTTCAPGVRQLLKHCDAVRALSTETPLFTLISEVLGYAARPVRAILFDKSPASNWYVTWHQDLSIPVRQQLDVPGFGPWSIKEGVIHVQPPANVLERMLSARIHLDDCDLENGPIKFIPGSHKFGILGPSDITSWKTEHEAISCAANRGDVILMRPLILHSSSKSDNPRNRRVLHLEYTSAKLPTGLDWAEA